MIPTPHLPVRKVHSFFISEASHRLPEKIVIADLYIKTSRMILTVYISEGEDVIGSM
jgi:hypothetical protein